MSNSDIAAHLDSLKNGVKQVIDSDRAADLKSSAMVAVDRVGKLIKDHPIAAVAIGFGVGFLATRMIRR